jgi:hypothetical protein
MTKTKTLLLSLIASSALAQTVPATCDAPHDVDKYQLLRRLSLDLRGRVPSFAEYNALDAQATVTPAQVKSFLATDDFRQVMRRYHEELFWPNVSNVRLNNVNSQLGTLQLQPAGSNAYLIGSAGRRVIYRGDADLTTATHGRGCGDFEQTTFDPAFPGQFRIDPASASAYKEVQGGKTVVQEGYRLVHPYWDPSPTAMVKVCAFDAQETPTVVVGGKTLSCGESAANGSKACGCGANLRFCYGPTALVANPITTALREQLGRAVDKVSTGGKPYTDLLLSSKADVNGPISYWKRYMSNNLSLSRIFAIADASEDTGTYDFTDTTWHEVDRNDAASSEPSAKLHAGVVTMPAYLLRFQTNRGRANRFRIDFECESFVPPSSIEGPGEGTPACASSGTDLTGRCTCRYCHRILEPLAAGFGQFAEAGTTVLAAAQFPRSSTACKGSNSAFCGRFYVTDPDDTNPGALLPYQYADATHPTIGTALAAGPKKRANEIIADGTFARCAVKRVFSSFVKRDMHVVGAQIEELPLLTGLADGFKTNGYSLPWLVEQVVTLPQYRRVR